MGNLSSIFLIFALLGVCAAKADETVGSYALAPAFHYIDAVKVGTAGNCDVDSVRSFNFSWPMGPSHSLLGDLKLNLYPITEPGGENFRQIEIIGTTIDKVSSVKVQFVTTKAAAAILVKGWTRAPKRKLFSITVDSACAGGAGEYNQVSSFSKTIF